MKLAEANHAPFTAHRLCSSRQLMAVHAESPGMQTWKIPHGMPILTISTYDMYIFLQLTQIRQKNEKIIRPRTVTKLKILCFSTSLHLKQYKKYTKSSSKALDIQMSLMSQVHYFSLRFGHWSCFPSQKPVLQHFFLHVQLTVIEFQILSPCCCISIVLLHESFFESQLFSYLHDLHGLAMPFFLVALFILSVRTCSMLRPLTKINFSKPGQSWRILSTCT